MSAKLDSDQSYVTAMLAIRKLTKKQIHAIDHVQKVGGISKLD